MRHYSSGFGITRNPRDHLAEYFHPGECDSYTISVIPAFAGMTLRQELRACDHKRSSRSLVADPRGDVRSGAFFTPSSSPTGVWVVEEQRKSPGDASVHGRSRHALPRPPHLLGFGACLGRYLLAGSETDQIVQCGAYRGDLADPLRRLTSGRLSLNPNSRFALCQLLHLCLLSAAPLRLPIRA